MYGLNNNLKSANNTNRTQNSAKYKKIVKGGQDALGILSGLRNESGFQRLKAVARAFTNAK